jgi:RHS repeat-associated protein
VKGRLAAAAWGDKLAYTYDGDGHRTKIVATTAAGVATTTLFTYQGGVIVGETVNGTPSRSYLAAGDSMAEMTIPSGSGAGTYIVNWNGHGDASSLSLLNADGSLGLANSYTYSTWGAPTTTAAGGASDLGFRFLYVGSGDVQWDNDFSAGLTYMHTRHYAAALGRFLQPDSSRQDPPFLYASNTPISAADPDGTQGSLIDVNLGLLGRWRFTTSEWAFCLSHLSVCLGVIQPEAHWAANEATRLFHKTNQDGDGYRGNAFQHCIWSAICTIQIGYELTQAYTTAHEDYSGNNPPDMYMDLYNNAFGRLVGLSVGRLYTVSTDYVCSPYGYACMKIAHPVENLSAERSTVEARCLTLVTGHLLHWIRGR